MGIESGGRTGLKVLKKEMTVAQNVAAVEALKELGVMYRYGFMLFHPSSSFASVRENIGFLRRLAGDRSAAATFSRMQPYGGTPIRDRLAHEGRLRGELTRPDYVFLDPRLNDYHRLLDPGHAAVAARRGTFLSADYALDELDTICRLVPGVRRRRLPGRPGALTRESNERLFDLVERSSRAFEAGDRSLLDAVGARAYCET